MNIPHFLQKYQPEWALVCGSGLGRFVDDVNVVETVPYDQVGGLPASKVPGHAGQFVLGKVSGRRLIIAQDRVHLYEGHSAAAVTAGVPLVAAAGATKLVLTNAAGTTNPAHPPGSWMTLNDHLNFTGTTPLLGGGRFIDMMEVYSPRLRRAASEKAKAPSVPLHEGIYAGLLGPQHETPAEVRMLQRLGADAVGMSTVLEGIQGRALGLEVTGFSCVTNWAAGISAEALNHQEVLNTGREAASIFTPLLAAVLESPTLSR